MNFNPRPPRGGRPEVLEELRPELGISIHALPAEGDRATPTTPSYLRHFNPRPPRGGRPASSSSCVRPARFQSTPSPRRATGDLHRGRDYADISIHALPAEGDPAGVVRCAQPLHISIHALPAEGDYLRAGQRPRRQISIHALPAEGDLETGEVVVLGLDISIHALPAEGDIPGGRPP